MIRRLPTVTLAIVSSILVAGLAQLGGASVASADGYTFTPGTPSLDTITNGTTAAPWNLSQGDSASSSYASQAPGTLLPTYTPGGAAAGGEPNLAVYPGATSGTDGNTPYPSGTVGTPGPLDGYCGSGSQTTESGGFSGPPAGRDDAASRSRLFPPRRAERGRLADRVLRLPAQGRRRGDHRRRGPQTTRRAGPTKERRWKRTPATAHRRTSTMTARATPSS